MRAQVEQRDERLSVASNGNGTRHPERPAAAPPAVTGVLAGVAGEGMSELFTSMGAHVLDGGHTLNPSTHELLAGIHEVHAEQVVVLPNSANVLMAAERAAELSDKEVHVVPARSQQAGLSALVALVPDRGAAANAAAMQGAIARLRTGAVAPAARDDRDGRFGVGDAVGFVDEEIVAWGRPEPTLRAVLQRLAADAELVTCIAGESAPFDGSEVAALAPAGVELELEQGGQPSFWWLLAAE
jgi:dihydroxyacetone kinase-like predicted kinase